MATFKLGAIVTEIAGSIGGTTFKRNGSSRVMMNKQNGSAYSRLLTNPSLSYLGSIFKRWSYLEPAEKENWNAQALLYTFPDKFGTLRNLSGRQFYIKLNSQAYVLNPTPISASAVSSEVPVFSLDDFVYTIHNGLFKVSTSNYPVLLGTYLYMFEVSLQPLHAPTFVQRAIIDTYTDSANITKDVTTAFKNAFPYWDTNYNVRVYVTTMNASGFRSVMQYKDLVISA